MQFIQLTLILLGEKFSSHRKSFQLSMNKSFKCSHLEWASKKSFSHKFPGNENFSSMWKTCEYCYNDTARILLESSFSFWTWTPPSLIYLASIARENEFSLRKICIRQSLRLVPHKFHLTSEQFIFSLNARGGGGGGRERDANKSQALLVYYS